jgi:hypothetical protein
MRSFCSSASMRRMIACVSAFERDAVKLSK